MEIKLRNSFWGCVDLPVTPFLRTLYVLTFSGKVTLPNHWTLIYIVRTMVDDQFHDLTMIFKSCLFSHH